MGLYDELLAAGCKLANHESDLYVEVSPISTAIVKRWHEGRKYTMPGRFRSEDPRDNGAIFYDIPFQYSPYWRKRGGE